MWQNGLDHFNLGFMWLCIKTTEKLPILVNASSPNTVRTLKRQTLKSGGQVGNMLAWHAVNPGSIPSWQIQNDLDDHYNGGPVSLDPQWYVKEPWRHL